MLRYVMTILTAATQDRKGVTALEYAVLAVAVIGAVSLGATNLGAAVAAKFAALITAIG